MRNIRIVIEYDGTSYHGFQDQAREDYPTIQSVLEKAIERVLGERIRLTGAGRTDAGVHAIGQVANFKTSARIPIDKVPVALNTRLPRDIVVRAADVVPPLFHARIWAKRKTYRYTWYTRQAPSPFWHRYAEHVPQGLNIELMEQAVRDYEGEHDFSAFKSANSSAKTSVRHIYKAEIKTEGPAVFFDVEGSGFLYNMVRIMAGTLLEIGLERRRPESIGEALLSGERTQAGQTAPAQGLALLVVTYDEPWESLDEKRDTAHM